MDRFWGWRNWRQFTNIIISYQKQHFNIWSNILQLLDNHIIASFLLYAAYKNVFFISSFSSFSVSYPSVPSVYPILQFLQFFEGYPSLSFSYKSTLNSMPDFHSRFTARPPLIPMSWDQYYICKYYILHYPPPSFRTYI